MVSSPCLGWEGISHVLNLHVVCSKIRSHFNNVERRASVTRVNYICSIGCVLRSVVVDLFFVLFCFFVQKHQVDAQ